MSATIRTADPTAIKTTDSSKSTSRPGAREHVPLNSGLAKIISLELASDEDSTTIISKQLKVSAPTKVESSSAAAQTATASSVASSEPPKLQPLECPALLERKTAPLAAATPVKQAQQVISYNRHVPPLSSNATRMAEAQEVLALYQQQQSNLQEQIQLEQLRRMQAAMLLYQHPHAATLQSLLASHHHAAANFASEMFSNQRLFPHLPQATNTAVPQKAVASEGKIKAEPKATASGTSPGLLSLAPKRPLDGTNHNKPVSERPEEYQHLSKKARGTPAQLAVSVATGEAKHCPPQAQTSKDSDDQSQYSDVDLNGQRFRPYQYEQWTEKFQDLISFRKEKGHWYVFFIVQRPRITAGVFFICILTRSYLLPCSQVPHTYKENPALARWVKRQRYQYKLKVDGKMSTMTDERITLLENIGFIWDSHAAAWAEKLYELKDFTRRRGHCNVPSTFPENPQLATWVKCQRRQYKLLRDDKVSNMTVDRILELEKVGFVWEVRKTVDSSSFLPPGMGRMKVAAIAATKASKAA